MFELLQEWIFDLCTFVHCIIFIDLIAVWLALCRLLLYIGIVVAAGSIADGNRRLLFSIVVREIRSRIILHVPILWFNKNKFRIDLSSWRLDDTFRTHTHCDGIYCRCASMGKFYLHFRRFSCILFHSIPFRHPSTVTLVVALLHSLASYCFHFSLASNNAAITSIYVLDRTIRIKSMPTKNRRSSILLFIQFNSTSFDPLSLCLAFFHHNPSIFVVVVVVILIVLVVWITSNVKNGWQTNFYWPIFPFSTCRCFFGGWETAMMLRFHSTIYSWNVSNVSDRYVYILYLTFVLLFTEIFQYLCECRRKKFILHCIGKTKTQKPKTAILHSEAFVFIFQAKAFYLCEWALEQIA